MDIVACIVRVRAQTWEEARMFTSSLLPRTALAVALACVAVVDPSARAADAGSPATLPACIAVKTASIYVPYGYNHVVRVTNGMLYGPGGFSERPCPRKSAVTTRNRSEKKGTCPSQSRPLDPNPCTNKTTSPSSNPDTS
jgi:hypothetical protein